MNNQRSNSLVSFGLTGNLALKIILGISLFGVAFSGVLSYQELFGASAITCPAPGAPGTVFGYPACVYGFFMYVALSIIALLGLRFKQPKK
jgi:uncharacterized membrane protein